MTQPSDHTCIVLIGFLLASTVAQAQNTQAAKPAATAQEGASDIRIERIRVEDSGVRIDELRVRGETQSITVTPKGNLPAYEVEPASANRSPSAGERGSASAGGGTRVWKIFGF